MSLRRILMDLTIKGKYCGYPHARRDGGLPLLHYLLLLINIYLEMRLFIIGYYEELFARAQPTVIQTLPLPMESFSYSRL